MKSYAQAGQDEWVHDLIGDHGFFIDVGAHDGIVHSNTYALEQMGWAGLCIEPDPGVWPTLLANRGGGSDLRRVAVGDRNGRVAFDGVRVGVGPEVDYRTLATMLIEMDAPPVIDYLSIDVEGHELEVLDGMSFDRWHVRLATIEHNLYCDGPARKWGIAAVMEANGFERIVEDVVAEGYGPYEDWWMHRDG